MAFISMLFKDQFCNSGPVFAKLVECQRIYRPFGRDLERLVRPRTAGTTTLANIEGYQTTLFDVKRSVLAGFPSMMAMTAQGFTLMLVSHFRFFERENVRHRN
jgi:hypothetical protein